MADRIIRSRGPMVRSLGKRRATEWFPSADVTATSLLPAASFALIGSLNAAEKAKRPFTVTRTVGNIWCSSDQVASLEFPFGALGLMVVSDKAVATGVTALPDPITEEGSDEWFTYRSFAVAGGPIDGSGWTEFSYDSRAQRKVQDGEDIVVMITNADAAFGLRFIMKLRILIKVA